ncbi:MAG: putative Fe-S cluster assembly protein SufT, partial [Proteobacteria bacterium]|nr:putative Fe-S cluster assembly protein SufT [Pseudomonadota bacterium]
MNRRMVVVQRDCPARLVPAGTRITLPKDTFVTLTQALGGTYTVNVGGNLARVDGTDADALGMEPLELAFEPSSEP